MLVHVEGPISRHWSEGDSEVTMTLREVGLGLNNEYTAFITVSTLAGQESINIAFGEHLFCLNITAI